MKPHIMKRTVLTALCIISLLIAPFGAVKAEAKSEREKVVELAAMVRPYPSYQEGINSLKVAVVLANTKPKVEREAESPDKTVYNEYSLSDFEKNSKNIFGKVIDLDIPKKKNNNDPEIYYNAKNKTIYMPLFYDAGDSVEFTKHIEVKRVDGGFEVSHYDTLYHWGTIDRRANNLTKIQIKSDKSSKYGYIIQDIEFKDLPASKMDLSKKAVDKQVKDIKKWWYGKPTSANRKEEYKSDGINYSMLYHNDNLVFILKNDGKKLFRYYYKYGVLIHAIESTVKGNKTIKEYEAYFKNGDYYINKHNLSKASDMMEELIELVKEADQVLEILVNR